MWTGRRIKDLRLHLGMSQVFFAEELGVRQATVSSWETMKTVPRRHVQMILTRVANAARFPLEEP